jgi:tRNA A-37 threonylcarbamoyl transferase component Bud32
MIRMKYSDEIICYPLFDLIYYIMQGKGIKVSLAGTISSQIARLILKGRKEKVYYLAKITSKMTKERNTRDYVIILEECGSVKVHVEVGFKNGSL